MPGRWVSVEPERLAGWVDRFAAAHGPVRAVAEPAGGPVGAVTLTAADGAVAECRVPFPPLALPAAVPPGAAAPGAVSSGDRAGAVPSFSPPPRAGRPGADPAAAFPPEAGGGVGPAGDLVGRLVAHATRDRRVAVLLVRLGGYAAGVFDGTKLVASKVGSRQVHGRSAAGGQSQQRFARRREGQARVALGAAADTAAAVLLPYVSTVDAVVLGGDRRAVDTVLADPRLAALRPLAVDARLEVPDPRLKVLQQTPAQFRAVRIMVTEGDG